MENTKSIARQAVRELTRARWPAWRIAVALHLSARTVERYLADDRRQSEAAAYSGHELISLLEDLD